MAITGPLLKIEGWEVPNIKEYIVTPSKLWTDAERNMAGGLRATLIGVFPVIQVTISHLDEDQMQTLVSKLDKAKISVEYYDAKTKSTKTADFYAADYDRNLFRKDQGLYTEISFKLISYEKE